MGIRNTREKLLRIAIDLLSQKGYGDTSIRDIGAKAGVNTSNIYYYFKSKEEILFEIIRLASQDLIQMLREVEERVSDPVECLWEMLMANMILFSLKRKKEIKIISSDRYWLRGEQREMIRKMQREIWDIYFKKLKEIDEMGLLKDVDMTVANFCISNVVVGFHEWYREDGRLSGEEVAQNIGKFVLNAILDQREYSRLMDRSVNRREDM